MRQRAIHPAACIKRVTGYVRPDDDPAFCSVRHFAFGNRVPDLGLCLARGSSRARVHDGKRTPNAS